jgi:Fe-Mn family superoxide dismutase
MITRRAALKTLALTTGAAALGSLAQAQPPAAPAPASAPTPPAPAPAPETSEVFKLPPLGYNYDALEPYIDAETMKLHHDKHHAAYVAKLNQALVKVPAKDRKPVEELLANLDALPAEIRTEVRNQGGGHANHSLFWQTLKKNEGGKPDGELAKRIVQDFGSYDDFWKLLANAALSNFGSGWAWLAVRERKLVVEQTPNQDSPILTGGFPLLGLDVWEHAYYLKYQNRRAEYIAAFQNVINWAFVGERFGKLSI